MPSDSEQTSVALCVFATGRYVEFISALAESVDEYFLPEARTQLILFSDQQSDVVDHVCFVSHAPWPLGTLLRHHYLLKKPFLRDYDYLFLCDADMVFIRPVGAEILGSRVALLGHHHTRFQPWQYPYCRKKDSTAYIPHPQGEYYFVGGFQGGASETYLADCEALATAVRMDLRNHVIADWHDESYWNRHLVDHPPTVVLPWGYAMAESEVTTETRISFVVKDHDAYRDWY
jgi:hypothetical protein